MSRKPRTTAPLMAKLTFCGVSPVILGGVRGTQRAHHHADDVPRAVEQRAAAVARLHRRGDLEPLRVVARAGEGADVAARHVQLLRQEPVQRVARHGCRLAKAGAGALGECGRLADFDRRLEQRQIVAGFHCPHRGVVGSARMVHGHSGAAIDDVMVGHDHPSRPTRNPLPLLAGSTGWFCRAPAIALSNATSSSEIRPVEVTPMSC